MTNYYFVSDTHFGHDNIIKLCDRPFSSSEEMTEVLVQNWNSVVKNDDVVYHLGDFAYGDVYKNAAACQKIFDRLRGTKILIQGNHDDPETMRQCGWHMIVNYMELTFDKKTRLVLFHYPITEWNGFFRGSMHLYGHCHGNNKMTRKRSMDVGVDCTNFRPLSLDEVKIKLA